MTLISAVSPLPLRAAPRAVDAAGGEAFAALLPAGDEERQADAADGKDVPKEAEADWLAVLGLVPGPVPFALTPPPPFVLSEVEARGSAGSLEAHPSTSLGTNGVGGVIGSQAPVTAGTLEPTLALTPNPQRTDGATLPPFVPSEVEAPASSDTLAARPSTSALAPKLIPSAAEELRRNAQKAARTAPPPVEALMPPGAPTPAIDLAARTFADARHRAVAEEPAPSLAPAAITTLAVAAPADAAQQAPLDLTQHRWPEAMIQHIERLRDMADANDMSIRLAPDALGTIDVQLKRDGDAVQVQLTAEHAHTRQLLADAQPKLAELAAERGVRLQHAGTGSNGSGDTARQPHAPILPAAPPSATGEAAQPTDDRIA